jgi:signal transduction histidine kinase
VANNIYDVVNDGNRLWFGTEAGVMGVTLTSLMQENPEIEFLSRQSGLVSNEVYNLVQIQNSLWAFSDKGFSIVDKDQTRFSNKSPQFYLKNVFINESPVTIKKEDRLRPDQNNIKLEYGFIAYNNQRIFTRHRLHTTDQWNYTSLRALQFYALAPGEYNFDVEFSTDNINWKSGYSLSSFTILPPLWKRWYFLTAFWLVVLIIIFLYFRNQLMIYRRHQQKLMESEIKTVENERSRIAKDLHDSVGTDFTAIKMMVNQEMQKYDAEKTKVIEHQFQHTLQEIKDIIYNLSPPGLERYGLLTGIHNYVDRLKGSLPIEIDLNCFGPEIKNKNISITVFRILQELISNSVKHSKAKNISLHINSFKDMLSIVYEDNGNGFVVDTQTKGLGLYNIESRVQSVSGKMKFESGSFGVSYTIDIPLK